MESRTDCRVATPICETTASRDGAYGPGSNQDAFASFAISRVPSRTGSPGAF